MIGKIFKWIVALLLIGFIALFVWGYAPELSVEELKADYANGESEFVGLGGGLTVHLRDEGPKDAPAIILLHGSNASLHTWDGWTDRLKDTYRIIRFDQAGHGLTGPHPKDCYTIDCYVDVVDRVAANRGLTRFILGGNSMGGGISYAYARTHPEKLAGLILVDASGAPQTKKADLPIGFKIARTPGINRLTQIITPRSIIETSLTQSVSNKAVVTPANVDLYWKMLRREGNRRATGLRFAEYAKRKAYTPLKASPIPALILWGADDKLIAASDAKWFAAQFPNSQTKIYKDIGHLPMEETPEKSAADVKAWAGSVISPARP
ncbi:alpha/beta fold hydrolase [Sphingorhabdus arenilitoris]|uniref:Alpha/beta fold hydrolase n=1 Tax=Sphingorhabdus arenilitoris TaxID=1490041 RepID=A0ABV8RFB2_9SPHN